MRQTGTVKFFSQAKGYGFITPDQGAKDIFVHITAVERSAIGPLDEGMRISFQTEPDKRGKGPKAVDLMLADTVEPPAPEPPPPLPRQGAGPHFRIDEDGRVKFAASASLDGSGNNVDRLRSLQPLLVQGTRELASALSPNE